MSEVLRIRFGQVHILGRPLEGRPVDGLYVKRDGFTGWDDSGDARWEAIDMPGQHGQFDVPVMQGPRTVTIAGWALARTDRKLAQLRSVVTGLGAEGPLRPFIDHRGETLWANARRGGKTEFRDAGLYHGIRRAGFVLQLVCANPRKYGATRTFPGGRAAFHYGNFPAVPKLIVTGSSAGGYTVTGPQGRRITVTAALTSAGHEIDLATGTLTVGGVPVLGGLTRFEPWTIPPGQSVAATTSAGSLTVSVTDTYI